MSIESFIESAKILYDNQKYEEALCLVCIAIDATAAKIYPNEKIGKRYKSFLKENFSTICKYGFPGIEASSIRIKVNIPVSHLKTDKNGYVDMEQIIYYVLRCGLVHECDIEKVVMFTSDTMIGDWNKDNFYLPKDIIWGLIASMELYYRTDSDFWDGMNEA